MKQPRGAWLLASVSLGCSPSSSNLGDLPSTLCDDPQAVEVLDHCFERSTRETSTSFEPLHLLLGDLDADGAIDLLSLGVAEGVVTELFSGGPRGPEAPGASTSLTGCSAYPLGGHIDADASVDVVFPSCETSIDIFFGGTVPPTPGVRIEVGLTVRSIAPADLELDGDVDLVALGTDAAGVLSTALLVADAGVFGAPVVEPVGPLSFDPHGIDAGDLDGDGRSDLVLRETMTTPRIAVRLATGPGTFEPWRALELPAIPRSLVLADFVGDGNDGIAFADPGAGRVCVLPGVAVEDTVACIDLDGVAPSSLAAGDFDDDGAAELVVADARGTRLRVLARDDAGALVEVADLSVPEPADLVFVADVNGEGTLDVVGGHFAARAFSIRLGLP